MKWKGESLYGGGYDPFSQQVVLSQQADTTTFCYLLNERVMLTDRITVAVYAYIRLRAPRLAWRSSTPALESLRVGEFDLH